MASNSMQSIQQLAELLATENPKNKHQAHNLTVAQMEQLRLSQANGENSKKIPANKKAGMEINEIEKHLVHVVLMKNNWITLKGKAPINKGVPCLQKFSIADFAKMSKVVSKEGEATPQNAFADYDVVDVIHDGTDSTLKVENKTRVIDSRPLTDYSTQELKDAYEMELDEIPSDKMTNIQLIAAIEGVQNQRKALLAGK